jgi:hypothetical protein
LQEARMSLRKTPQNPPSSAIYIYGKHIPEYQEWLQYVENW